MAPKRSVAWDHFVDKGNYIGECKMCKAKISFKSGVSNLTKHVQRKHLAVNLVTREVAEPQQQQSAQNSAQEAINPQRALPQSQFVPATSVIRNPSMTAFLRRDCNKIKKDIDDHIMNLFIQDIQPFTIVEDKGFRELIKFAFPNYVIPTRKYFANNLLPAQYEAVKMTTKALVNKDATSICLTTDLWTSRNNDAYLAVTGHFIDSDYILRSVLLECKVLEKSHTGNHLAEELKNVVQDWNVSNKVLLVVSDNGANIKNAITMLQWKHFGCYAHTLNLAVQKALGTTALINLLNKVKCIVSYFKRSNLAWNKLKKYQEQANKTVKRPIQDVATRWNSTFYMLQRFVELKDEMKCAISNLDSANIIALTSYEWDICESLIVVLQPCEEVTREMSGQKYVSGSSVLPITVGLSSALKEIADPAYLQTNNIAVFPNEVEMCRQDLLSEVTTRFSNVQNSKTFTTAMFLDPRYKLYFENQIIADNTKKHVIALVTAMINEENVALPSTSQQEEPAATRKPQSLIWKHYNETMQNVRPAGTANSRAIIEVQRYLDDTIITPDINPLEWWRCNRNTYPNLAKLARTRLNAMATSVPCERLFSAAGNILTERRNRLGSRKVQQLLFLQQNQI